MDDWGDFYYGRSCPKWSVTEDATIPCIRYGELYTKFGAKIDRVYSYTNIPPEKLRFSKGTEVLIPRVGEDPMDYNHCTWLSMPDIAIGEMISVFNTDNNPLFTATMFNATLQNEFAMRVEGGSVTNLYFEKLKNIEVSFPSIPEQEKIAAYLNSYLEAAKIQGFKWSKPSYVNENTGEIIDVCIDEKTYLILVLRYKELGGNDVGMSDGDAPYDLEGYITEIDTGLIDSDYMNSRFDKYIKLLYGEGSTQETVDQAETELHKTFATLSQEEQKYANIFLHDIQRGDVEVTVGKSLRDYINEYMSKAKDNQIHQISFAIGVDEEKLRIIMDLKLNDTNINEFGRYEELRQTIDKNRAKEYFERIEGRKIIPPKVNIKVDKLLREFIIRGGFEIQMPEEYK